MGLMIFLGGSALSVPGPRGACRASRCWFSCCAGQSVAGYLGVAPVFVGVGGGGGGVNCWGAGRWAIILWGLGTFLMFPNYLRS